MASTGPESCGSSRPVARHDLRKPSSLPRPGARGTCNMGPSPRRAAAGAFHEKPEQVPHRASALTDEIGQASAGRSARVGILGKRSRSGAVGWGSVIKDHLWRRPTRSPRHPLYGPFGRQQPERRADQDRRNPRRVRCPRPRPRRGRASDGPVPQVGQRRERVGLRRRRMWGGAKGSKRALQDA